MTNLTDAEIKALVAQYDDEAQAEFETWLATRPESVQALGAKYPPSIPYRVRDGAPYGGSAPGCIVAVFSYYEDGTVSVVVVRPSSIVSALLADTTRFQMDPAWLEPYEVTP